MSELFVTPKYGYLSAEDLPLLEAKNPYKELFESGSQRRLHFPPTDSIDQLEELKYIQEVMKAATSDDIRIALNIDTHLREFFAYQFEGHVKVHPAFFRAIFDALKPTIMQLKQFYNRARPHQIGYYLDQPIFPYKSFTAQSPAFPGGHATQARFAALCFAELYPKMRGKLEKTQSLIAHSRLRLGLHYTSDTEAGFDVADRCFESPQTQRLLQNLTKDL